MNRTAHSHVSSVVAAIAVALAVSACQAAPVVAPDNQFSDLKAPTVNLVPPPPDEGFQIVVGPFAVNQGEEVQNNFFMKLPNTEERLVKRIEIAFPKGSHHCNLFKSDTKDVPDHVENTFSAMYPEYDMFANSQSGDLNWVFPQGVGMKFKANQQILVQTHYVNTLTQVTPGNAGLVKVNFWYADPKETPMTMGMLFAVNPSLNIPPHSTWLAQKAISLSDLGFNKDVKIAAISGHMHSRGKTFEVNRWSGRDPSVRGEALYKSDNWQEPPMTIYSNPLSWKANERLLYSGTYVNKSDMYIGFGAGNVDTKEHSNLFLYFYPGPSDGRAVYDVEASQFQEVSEI